MANLTTLDGWLSSWGPSASLFRWYVQAVMLNEAKDNNDIFPTVEGVFSCDYFDFSIFFLFYQVWTPTPPGGAIWDMTLTPSTTV